MKLWTLMYALVWVALIQILIVLFPIFGDTPAYVLHFVVGLIVIGLSFHVYLRVKRTACPPRIKRITKTTAVLALVQGLLGLVLYADVVLGVGGLLQSFVVFLHAVTAIAIITQAAASATAYDMWEEKEFIVPTS